MHGCGVQRGHVVHKAHKPKYTDYKCLSFYFLHDELNLKESTFFSPNIGIIIAPVRLQQGSSGSWTVDELCPLRSLLWRYHRLICRTGAVKGGNPTAC